MAKAAQKDVVVLGVQLSLTYREASELASILMYDVNWDKDNYGGTAEAVYDALLAAGIKEA